ncbi:MAG: sporulation protein YunB [Clostridia bacterium]|nr:sporulation protein YunB [Clostridia bacterium]
MRTKRHIKLNLKHKLFIFFACFVIFIFLVLMFFVNCIKPIMIKTSEAQVRSSTSKAVNGAVQTVINESNIYDDLIEITTDDEGNIIFIQVKSLMVNKLAKEISKVATQNLDLITKQGVSIPIGTLSGISVLVGVGPDITFHIMAISTLSSKFSSEFTSAGINQTNHRIYLNLQTNVELIMPTASRTIVVNSHILICEAILVGKIPSTYLNSDSLDEMMNLIPD